MKERIEEARAAWYGLTHWQAATHTEKALTSLSFCDLLINTWVSRERKERRLTSQGVGISVCLRRARRSLVAVCAGGLETSTVDAPKEDTIGVACWQLRVVHRTYLTLMEMYKAWRDTTHGRSGAGSLGRVTVCNVTTRGTSATAMYARQIPSTHDESM